jgi:hypothetical protein
MESSRETTAELLPPTHAGPSVSWRVVGPSQQEWLDIKGVFTQLYINENRRLKEVRAILSRTHNFHASEKMFKRRINDWKIHKNYKAKEKELLAKRVKACVEAGRDVHSISFRGRPLKLDRVRRQYRGDERYAQIFEQLAQSQDEESHDEVKVEENSPVTDTTASKRANDSSSSPELPRIAISGVMETEPPTLTQALLPPTDLYDIELALFEAQQAIQWQFTAFRPLRSKELEVRFPTMIPEAVRQGQTDQVSAFWLGIYRGFNYFQIGRGEEAWSILDTCCNMVQPLIHSAPLQLLSCLLVHFATPWQGMAALEQHLLGFISSMTESLMGQHHPLTKALQTMTTANLREHVVESMMQLVVHGYHGHRKPTNSSLFALRIDQIDLLRKRKKFQQAHYLCQNLIRDCQYMRPKRYRTALAALGRLFAEQNESLAMESVAHQIIQHETSDTGTTNSSSAAWAFDQLATACMSRGDYLEAQTYLRRGAAICRGSLPHRGPSTESFIERLEMCTMQLGHDSIVQRSSHHPNY